MSPPLRAMVDAIGVAAGSLIVAILSVVIANRSLWLNWKHWKDERHTLVKVLVGHDLEPRQKTVGDDLGHQFERTFRRDRFGGVRNTGRR
jgi:hypothetical protein